MPDNFNQANAPEFGGDGFFFVRRGDEVDVIWRGAKNVGQTAADRARNFFPRIVCSCAEQQDAELICELLEGTLR